jgi:protein-S-isoprenylcysteine O-methyltransferase Ste14
MQSDPALVRTLFLVTVVIWLVLEVRQAQNHRPEANPADGGSRPIVRLSYVIGVVGAVIGQKAVPSAAIGSQTLTSWIGLVIVWCGVGLRFWSFHTLGRYFTFTVQTRPDQPVISAGPYRVIRHPSYAGVLLASVGVGFIIGNWASLAFLATAITCGLVYRINIEERALSQDLGGRYQSYAESRKRLVPFVW